MSSNINVASSVTPPNHFYVLPLQSTAMDCDEVTQTCFYYYKDSNGAWIKVDGSVLQAQHGLVELTQASAGEIKGAPAPESDVWLFGAVGKNVVQRGGGLMATVQWDPVPKDSPLAPASLKVKVESSKTVSVILLFAKIDNGNNIVNVRASYDPEIKGST
jgi:hypothetical protein